jgi:hypothetical protein
VIAAIPTSMCLRVNAPLHTCPGMGVGKNSAWWRARLTTIWECAFGSRPYHLFWGTPYSGGGSHGGSDEVASDE